MPMPKKIFRLFVETVLRNKLNTCSRALRRIWRLLNPVSTYMIVQFFMFQYIITW